jgi:hypothetical protein
MIQLVNGKIYFIFYSQHIDNCRNHTIIAELFWTLWGQDICSQRLYTSVPSPTNGTAQIERDYDWVIEKPTGNDYKPLLQSEQSCLKQKLVGQFSAASSDKSGQEIALAHTVEQNRIKYQYRNKTKRKVPRKENTMPGKLVLTGIIVFNLVTYTWESAMRICEALKPYREFDITRCNNILDLEVLMLQN